MSTRKHLGYAAVGLACASLLSWFVAATLTQTAAAAPAESASAPTASASAPSSSAAATPPAPDKASPTFDGYAWPTEPSTEPTDDEWEHPAATEITNPGIRTSSWSDSTKDLRCTTSLVRAWARVRCEPVGEEPTLGVIWGMAGDLSKVSATFGLVNGEERFKKVPATNEIEIMNRRMGAHATITFQVQPGAALMLSLDQIGMEFSYDGGAFVFSGPGTLIDASWAEGEKSPTLIFGEAGTSMILFQKRFHEGILSGAVTLTFRAWPSARVKPGGRYRCHPIGVLEVEAIDRIRLGDISDLEARSSGFEDRATLVAYIGEQGSTDEARELFRIRFHHGGDGDRVEAALVDALTSEEVSALRDTLAKMDARSENGPWTRKTLALIGKHPRVAASVLAVKLRRDKMDLKADIVKLKKLGLTQSFEVGYEVSPRGRAFLAAKVARRKPKG